MRLTNIYKAEKGLIKINLDLENGVIRKIDITGDFFMIPEESIVRLKELLVGRKMDKEDIKLALEDFYDGSVDTPLLTKDDFITAIIGAK